MTQLTPSRGTPIALLGGGLGIAACFIGLLIFLTACGGISAVFMLSIIPLILGVGLRGGLKTLRPSLGGDGGGEIGKLLGLKRKDLIAGLGCLERAGG